MEIIDNVNKTLKDDMLVTLRSGSKVAIAASCFSIYAFQELKRPDYDKKNHCTCCQTYSATDYLCIAVWSEGAVGGVSYKTVEAD